MLQKSWLYWYLASMPVQARYIYTGIFIMLTVFGWYKYVYSPLVVCRMNTILAAATAPQPEKRKLSIADISSTVSSTLLLYPHIMKDFSIDARAGKARMVVEGKFEQIISFFGALAEIIDHEYFSSITFARMEEGLLRMECIVEVAHE